MTLSPEGFGVIAAAGAIFGSQISSGSSKIRPGVTLKEAREELEKELVETALKKHKGKITAASAALGISRPTFYELLDKLGIKR